MSEQLSFLLKSLSSSDPEVRRLAVHRIGLQRDPTAVDLLIDILFDASEVYNVRWQAALALGRTGNSRAFEPLLKVFQNSEPTPHGALYGIAAIGLGMLGDPRAFEPLVEAINTEDRWLRQCIATGLGHLMDPRAVSHLLGLLHDQSPDIRYAAAEALKDVGDATVISELEVAAESDDGVNYEMERVSDMARLAVREIKQRMAK